MEPTSGSTKVRGNAAGFERPQIKFSEVGAFLVNWAVAPPG